MSERNADNCGLCGSTREVGGTGGNEYAGRGCPSCGTTLSPKVGVKHDPEVGHLRITHDGIPIADKAGSSHHADSGVFPRVNGSYQASLRVGQGEKTHFADAKNPTAAAKSVTKALAAHMGKQFVERSAQTHKNIDKARKERGM